MYKIAVISGIFFISACTAEVGVIETTDDGKDATVVLEGSELEQELASSPTRQAPASFLRIGVIWDAPASQSLEISTSQDGQTWSDFQALAVHHIEAEIDATFVGELDVPGGAEFYRLRSAGTNPTFVSLEFLDHTLSDAIEDGERDDNTSGISSIQQGISIGNANVNARGAWGARAARCSSNHSPYRLTIHHTVTPTNDSMSPQARLRQIQSYHQDVRGWCDVGYHFLVSRDGRMWEGRPMNKLGSHVGGANSGNVGISFMGTHDSTPASATQISNVATLVAGVTDTYGITINSTNIKGHRDRGSTSCPGNALYGQLANIIDEAQGGGGTTEPPPPTGDLITIKGVIYEGSDTSARISGVTVTLGGQSVTSSETGFWEFRDVEPGMYQISASKAGFVTRTVAREATDAETWASMSLSRAEQTGTATLQGVVYTDGDSSNRVPEATVELSTGQTVTADGNGFYKLTNLAPGPVTITASKAGLPTRSVERTLENDATTWGSVNLQ